MNFWKRAVLVLTMASAFSVSVPALAAQQFSEARRTQATVADVLVARPLGILVTGAGALLFAVSLPFSALGGNVGEAAEVLVVKPARETFARCLGCTSPEQTSSKTDIE